MDDVFEGHQNGKPKRHDGKDPWSLVTRAELAERDDARAVVSQLGVVEQVAVGDAVAVVICRERDDTQGRYEEIWLEVTNVGDDLVAIFDSQPTYVRGVSPGDALVLTREHVVAVRSSRRR